VLRLKVLNLFLALLPVHFVFLGKSERLNKHLRSEKRGNQSVTAKSLTA
jgi:hypothetical protein